MDENKIREAFRKIKEDMLFLFQELTQIKHELARLKEFLTNTSPACVGIPTHNPTHNLPNYGLFPKNFQVSIGSVGVPTDRQTDRQQTNNILKRTSDSYLHAIAQVKQTIKEKFRSLTKQQFLIFSILYTLEEERDVVTYRDIAQKAGLSESSVRDYIAQLQRKGIPIIKERLNNKTILLKIPPELKDLASLKSLERSANWLTE